MVIAVPAVPAGWIVHRCDSNGVTFTKTDEAGRVFWAATASGVALAPWLDVSPPPAGASSSVP
jgi:hypothetical protein